MTPPHEGRAARLTRTVACKPILITGGAGFLGANLADRLAGEGRDVIVYDNLSRPGVESNLDWLRDRHDRRVTAVQADVRDAGALQDAVGDAAAVVHLAAQVAVTTSVDQPVEDFEINARGTLNLLEALRRRPAAIPLLFASTNKVYGSLLAPDELRRDSARWQPLDRSRWVGFGEHTPLEFCSPYGCSKGAADQYVLDYGRVYNLPTVVFRMSCLYGPRQFGTEDQGWVAHFLIAALRGQPITIYGDGHQVRDVLFVDDAVDAYLAALGAIDSVRGRAFNLGGGSSNAVSLLEMIGLIERASGLGLSLRFEDWRPGDQRWYVSDTRALGAAIRWQPRIGVEAGLRRLLHWLEDYLGPPLERPRPTAQSREAAA